MASTLLSLDQLGICPLSIPTGNVSHGIVSQALLTAPGLRATLFRFAAGQELSEHTSTARVLVQVISGSCAFSHAGANHVLTAGVLLHLPPNLPHAVRAVDDLTLLVMQSTDASSKDSKQA